MHRRHHRPHWRDNLPIGRGDEPIDPQGLEDAGLPEGVARGPEGALLARRRPPQFDDDDDPPPQPLLRPVANAPIRYRRLPGEEEDDTDYEDTDSDDSQQEMHPLDFGALSGEEFEEYEEDDDEDEEDDDEDEEDEDDEDDDEDEEDDDEDEEDEEDEDDDSSPSPRRRGDTDDDDDDEPRPGPSAASRQAPPPAAPRPAPASRGGTKRRGGAPDPNRPKRSFFACSAAPSPPADVADKYQKHAMLSSPPLGATASRFFNWPWKE